MHLRWIGPAPVLSIAIGVVWATIAVDAVHASRYFSLGLWAIGAFAACYLIANTRTSAVAHLPRRQLFVLLEAPAALVVYADLQNISYLALLVIVAAQLAHSFKRASAIAWLCAINGAVAWLLWRSVDAGEAIRNFMLFGGFQIFAVMTASFAVSARVARDELARANGELLSTRHLLQESTRVGERLRLSRELHDVMGHKLTALKLQLRQLVRVGPSDASGTAAVCSQLADELLRDVRGVVGALRTEDGIDLHQSLMALAQGLPPGRVELKLEFDVRVPQLDQANALLRCAQEGLTNALRHSDADHIVMSLARLDGGVAITVEDNGAGMHGATDGHGLAGMKERMQLLGGRLEIGPGLQRGALYGTLVRAWLP